MRFGTGAAILAAVFTSACQTTAQQNVEADPVIWFGFDCKRPIEPDFERAKLICVGRADAAAVAGTANIQPGYSTASAIVAGVQKNQQFTQINLAVGTSCMAEYGYRMSKRSEFETLCPLPPPSKNTMTKKPVS